MKMSKCQITVMKDLYDVAIHEGGGITLKNKYHSSAHALIRMGYVYQVDRFPYRPHYFLTSVGRAYWESLLTPVATDGLCRECSTGRGEHAVFCSKWRSVFAPPLN